MRRGAQTIIATALSLACVPAIYADGDSSATPPAGAVPPKEPWQRVKDAGLTPRLSYTGEEFGNFSGGVGRGGNYEGLLKLSLAVDLEKVAGWPGASAFVAALYPHGLGITNRYVHDYNVLSNIDAYDSCRLFEAWVQKDFADRRLSVRVGQLTTDNNFFASDNGELYINSAFGAFGTALHNINTPIYPVASPGVWLKISPTPAWYFQAMIVSDDPGAQNGNNKHGLRYTFDGNTGALMFFEAAYLRTGTDDAPVLEGKFKVGGYYDTGLFPDNQSGVAHRGNGAWWVVVDQQIYRESYLPKATFRGLSAFARVTTAPKDRNPVASYFDVGLNYTGLIRGHPKDILGVAFSYEHLSGELRQLSGTPVVAHREHIIEGTYLWTLNDHFAVQPDIQYIINPGGVGTTSNSVVGGLRFIISF